QRAARVGRSILLCGEGDDASMGHTRKSASVRIGLASRRADCDERKDQENRESQRERERDWTREPCPVASAAPVTFAPRARAAMPQIDSRAEIPRWVRAREHIALFGGQLRDSLANALYAKRIDLPLVDPSVRDEVGGGVDAHLALRPFAARAAPVNRGIPTDGEEPGADRATLGPVGA